MRRWIHTLLILAIGWPAAIGTAGATGSRTLEATFTSVSNGWTKVERWKDNSTGFAAETYPSDGRGDHTGQRVTFFGTARPHSSRFLLYYAPGWSIGTKPTPVLLVHGANQTADIAWANPNESGAYACGASTCPSTGLMQYLDTRSYKVFAITFSHKNGNGYYWGEQIYDAIEIIKSRTGASNVDVIGWSKGAFNARMYASSVKQSWGTAYAGNIRRLLLLGNPNNGVDGSFRHGWTYTFTVYSECGGAINGPVANDWIVCYGVWWNHPEWTYGSAYFPGSAQMLKKWDSVYGLATTEQDWYTTYYGGWGFYTHSAGIDAYMPSSLVNTVRAAGVPSSIRTHNLCGSANDIPLLHNEHTGPSDGVLFISSCTDNTGIGNAGGNVTLAINHLKLGWQTSAEAQIDSWLAAA